MTKEMKPLFLSHTVVLTSSKLQSCMLKWNFNLNWRGNMYQYTPKNIPHQRRQKQILYFKRNSPIILNMKNNHAWCSYQIYLPRLNKTYVALISSCERFLTFGKNVKGRVSHIYFDWSKLKTQNDVNRKKHCSYPFTSKLTMKVYLRFCQMQGLHKCSPPHSSWIEVKNITEWLN